MSNLLKGVSVYLIGMMGSGKTTIGQRLAERLGYRFFDTDRVIEQVAGQSVAQIFAEAGEPEFRSLETQVLAELSSYTRLAIATGGGIILKRENWSYLRHGIVVWLDVPLIDIQTRLEGDQSRPLLQVEDLPTRLQTLLEQRQSLYAQADVRVIYQAGETPEQVVDRVLTQISLVLKPEPSGNGQAN